MLSSLHLKTPPLSVAPLRFATFQTTASFPSHSTIPRKIEIQPTRAYATRRYANFVGGATFHRFFRGYESNPSKFHPIPLPLSDERWLLASVYERQSRTVRRVDRIGWPVSFFPFCLRNTAPYEKRGSRAIRSATFIPRITRELETCERVPIQRTK